MKLLRNEIRYAYEIFGSAKCLKVNFISLSALAENFIIRKDYFISSASEIFHLKTLFTILSLSILVEVKVNYYFLSNSHLPFLKKFDIMLI